MDLHRFPFMSKKKIQIEKWMLKKFRSNASQDRVKSSICRVFLFVPENIVRIVIIFDANASRRGIVMYYKRGANSKGKLNALQSLSPQNLSVKKNWKFKNSSSKFKNIHFRQFILLSFILNLSFLIYLKFFIPHFDPAQNNILSSNLEQKLFLQN